MNIGNYFSTEKLATNFLCHTLLEECLDEQCNDNCLRRYPCLKKYFDGSFRVIKRYRRDLKTITDIVRYLYDGTKGGVVESLKVDEIVVSDEGSDE
jgi:hypothetical protein